MPKDISSSSSEDEVESPTTEPVAPVRETEKITKYECPADFVSFCHVPCRNTLAERLKKNKNELWLIKAPASFNPECFSGIKVPLSGLQTLKVPTSAAPESGQKIYSILASDHATPELRLLTSSKQASNAVAFGPAFTGLLNICESYGDSSTNQAPQVIPAAPAPAIPTGLKQRFHPFGSKTPTLTFVAENEADGAAFGPSSTTLRPLVVKQFVEEAEEEGRKRKKKKKEKRIKSEVMEEVVAVKQEPDDEIQEEAMMELPFQEGDQLVEKRKKKKKKKDREQEEVEGGLEPNVKVKVEEVSVKSEPMDSWLGDAAESKKKKKKKKSRNDDD
ncbi:CD3e molecule, epsilon associated protein [Melanotaenia boesemani]|uniref:CD3e molecule, epsilon associated protein n=1 Tax=Melanotaenia boesemani TaxID=1250792 RepID=UPI001C046D26|nr:CD3e molecule, epsilon associated protein [Melanotaenia boesemani]